MFLLGLTKAQDDEEITTQSTCMIGHGHFIEHPLSVFQMWLHGYFKMHLQAFCVGIIDI